MAAEVTAVIPTRNRVGMLAQAVRSVLWQEGVDVELVVVDEGSSDATPRFLADLQAIEPRVRVVRHDDPKGLPAARNAGVAATSTPWVAFLDDDDLWAPGKLRAQLDALAATGSGWAPTGLVVVDESLEVIGVHRVRSDGDVAARLRQVNLFPAGSSVVVDTDLVRASGGFDESLRSSEDWEMWIRLAERSSPVAVDEPLVAYRATSGSMSTAADRMRDSRRQVLAAHGGRPMAQDDYDYERFLARQLVRGGERRAAASLYARLAWRHRRPDQLVHAALAATVPGRLDAVATRRARAEVPPAWVEASSGWLAELRTITPHGLLERAGCR